MAIICENGSGAKMPKTEKSHTMEATTYMKQYSMSMFLCFFQQISRLYLKKKKTQEMKMIHVKRSALIYSVLNKLPFLYVRSREVEESYWMLIAYELMKNNLINPETVRYQTGRSYYVSFGSIATQIKRDFYSLLLSNTKSIESGLSIFNAIDTTSTVHCEGIGNANLKLRSQAADKDYEYFTPEEIRMIVLNGERCTANFLDNEKVKGFSSEEWYHGWGYVYQTNSDCYLALLVDIGNLHLEMEVLNMLQSLGLKFAELSCTGTGDSSLHEMVECKKTLIQNEYLPEALAKKRKLEHELGKYKSSSETFGRLFSY